jgi:hypothetical protein
MKKTIEAPVKNTNTGKKATKETKLVTGKKGMELQLAENVTGAKVKKARKMSVIMAEKLELNNTEKAKRRSLTYNLNCLKGSAEKYCELLGTKYEVSISVDELLNTLKKPSIFLAYLSEKQKGQYEAKKFGFSYWLILGLVSKHFKANKAVK